MDTQTQSPITVTSPPMLEDIVRRGIKRELYCKLTEEEFTRIARQRATKEGERDELKADLAKETARRKAQIEELEDEISEMGQELRTGEQQRTVQCHDVFRRDLDGTGWIVTIRLDTFVEVERRPANAHETQRYLPSLDGEVGNGSVLDDARAQQRLAADKAEVSDVPAGDGDAEPDADDDAEEQPKRRRKAKE